MFCLSDFQRISFSNRCLRALRKDDVQGLDSVLTELSQLSAMSKKHPESPIDTVMAELEASCSSDSNLIEMAGGLQAWLCLHYLLRIFHDRQLDTAPVVKALETFQRFQNFKGRAHVFEYFPQLTRAVAHGLSPVSEE